MISIVLFFASCTVQDSTTTPTVLEKTEYVSVDESTFYPDADDDGYGDPTGKPITGSSVSGGYVDNALDCDDADKRINPGVPEVCDLVDNDCDGSVDNAASDEHVWFIDGDGDGYGDASATTTTCDENAPSRFSAVSTDCNDFRADMYPGAAEYCNDVDDNCDDVIDEDGAADGTVYYIDADGDGRGSDADDAVTVVSCDKPSGYVNGHTDCDDGNAEVRTGAIEICDGVDNDCDGSVDNDAADGTAYYPDMDLDGSGDMYSAPTKSCEAAPAGYVDNANDCDDWMDIVHPGAAEDCDWFDNDCDGLTDSDDPDVVNVTGLVWYDDEDCDGYGNAAIAGNDVCESTAYWSVPYCVSSNGDDCNDDPYDMAAANTNPGVDVDGDGSSVCDDCDEKDDDNYPGATEVADGEDNDCDGDVDEVETVTE